VALLAASSFLGGVIEATFLVVVTRIGLAIADGEDSFGVLADRSMSLAQALLLAAALVAIRFVLLWLSMRIRVSLNSRVMVAARNDLADAFLRASWATQQDEAEGRFHELIVGFASNAKVAAASFTAVVTSGCSLAALMIGSLWINPEATLAVIAIISLLALALAPLRALIRRRARAAAIAQMSFASSVTELGALGMEMQSYGVRDQFARRVNRLVAAHANARAKVEISQGMLTPVYTSMAYIALIAALVVASSLGPGSVDGAAAVMLVMLRSLGYGQTLQTAAAALVNAAPFLDEIEDTVSNFRAHAAEVGGVRIEAIGPICAHSVSFEYHPGVPVLKELSFSIEPGEVIGIVGPSGGGKSTLIQLLLGLRNPSSGMVAVGGVDLREIDRRSWARLSAFVAQDANLLPGTIEENITFLRPGIDPQSVRDAARRANVESDVDAMPDGFATTVGPRGSRLSGGQRQRVSIARALVGQPSLLIMDEPTSALDVSSEQLIRETVAALKGDVTVVIIAHRLSTLDTCDRIMVIEDGELKAMAPPADLARENAFFRRSLELSGLRP
jgi:ATP-binding cassette, subfamily B, bacterial